MDSCSSCKFVKRKPGRTWTNTSYEGKNLRPVDFKVNSVEGYCGNENSEMFNEKVFDTFKYDSKESVWCSGFCRNSI